MFATRCLASLARRPGLVRPTRLATSVALPLGASSWRGADHVTARRPSSRVWESTVADPNADSGAEADSGKAVTEEQETGHFSVKPNESLFFFENVFPKKLSSILRYPTETDSDMAGLLRRFNSSSSGSLDPIALVKRAIPDDMGLKVTEILPRLKDGGAFVKVQYDGSISPSEIESTLLEKLREHPLKPWFSPFRGIQARLVKGTPWLEDLYRFPSNLIKVEFVPPEPGASAEELSEECLYSLFRRYGKIGDIQPQAFDSKEVPRYAYIGYPRGSDAVMARNCMHGFVLSQEMGGGKTGTLLRLSYVKRMKAHTIWNWLTNHPRIVIPILVALLTGLSVIIFDPIRTFFIKVHVQHSLHFKDSRIYKWFKSQKDSFSFTRHSQSDGMRTIWNHRRDVIEQLQGWLDGSSDTFIVVSGPRGSGKGEMVKDQALVNRKNVLVVDCKPIVDASGEAGTIKRLAASVGYRPMFSWANSMSSMIDLAVQGTTGVKAGFSETLDSQVNKILHTTANALKEITLSRRSKKDKDGQLSEDAYLEAHPELRPVVVVDNYFHKNEESTIIYDKIAEWAASMVQNNIAHVIFLTSDSSATKPLAKAMPDRVFRSISLGDLDHRVAKNFVTSRLEDDDASHKDESDDEKAKRKPMDLTGLDQSIETLGGRLTDLEFLSRRIKAGQTPRQAMDEIVTETATDLVKIFLLGKTTDAERKWSTQQAWYLIKELANNPSLRYHQVLLSPTFASSTSSYAADGEAALEALSSAELVSVSSHQGRPKSISAGKPLHQAAFSLLVQDRVLKAKMDLSVLNEMAKVEGKSIESAEAELTTLGQLPKQTAESAGRITYLLKKLEGSQRNIEELEKQMGGLKKVMNEEY